MNKIIKKIEYHLLIQLWRGEPGDYQPLEKLDYTFPPGQPPILPRVGEIFMTYDRETEIGSHYLIHSIAHSIWMRDINDPTLSRQSIHVNAVLTNTDHLGYLDDPKEDFIRF